MRRQLGQRLDGAGAHLRQRHGALHQEKIDLTRHQIRHRRAGATIGHEQHLGVGEFLQQQPANLRRGILIDEFGVARMRLHPFHQRFKIVRRQIFGGDQQHWIDRHQSDRREVGLQIVIEVVDDAADVGVPLADVDGVAVRRCAREAPYPDRAAGAADILDDHRLPERSPHLVGQNTAGNIGRTARRERHDQRDGAGRVSLGVNGGDGGEKCQRDRNTRISHISPPQKLIVSLRAMIIDRAVAGKGARNCFLS